MNTFFPNRNSVRPRLWRRRDQIRHKRAAFLGSNFRVEQLEPRYLLTVAPLDYDTVSADWFETVAESSSADLSVGSAATDWIGALSDDGGSTNSDQNGWIVRLSPSALQTVSRVTEAVGLFSSAPGLRVLGGLGLPGQLLLESTACSSEIFSYLAGLGFISSFEPDLPISVSSASMLSVPNDPRYGDLYGLHNTGQSGGTTDADIDAPEAWQVSTGSRDLIVGVIDTGIDYTHTDLAANMWVNPGEIAGNGIDDDANGFIDDVHGYDFANDDGDPFDDNGHGTHCAGTIGGVGNNGIGVAGVNWEVSLMGLKFLDANGSGSTSAAIQAVNYATMMRNQYGQNVRVTSNSWGGGGSSNAMRQAIESGAEAEIIFIAAAGNDGMNNDTNPQYPASYTSDVVISVAATDRNDALANFSNYGATSVDIAAPGVGIVSTTPGNSYASFSGTSMATPHVAGAAALALAVDPTLTVSQLRSGLLGTVDAVVGLAGKTVTGGRLNVGRLVESLSSDPTVPLPPSGLNASDGSTLGSVRVSWGSSLFAESYTLWRNGTDDTSTATIIADNLATTSYQDVTAELNETYYYWASAKNELGTSPLSNSDSGFYSPSRSPNDTFVDRFILEGVLASAAGTNLDATEESGEPTHAGVGGGKSVWWTWTSPASGSVEINTVGSGFDTVLAVYEGSRVDDLTRLASNDDIDYGVVLQSRVTFEARAGQAYQIAVDGWSGASGSIALAVAIDASEPVVPIDEIALSNTTIAENLPVGTDIGMLTATGGTGGLAFELIAGAGDSGNEFFEIAGSRLRTDAVLDYESEPTHSIRVRATDQAGQTSEQTFLIIVENTSEISFNYGFSHINEENAEDFLLSSNGMRKYSEWQSPPITYWGPSSNNQEGQLVYKFPVSGLTTSASLYANSPTWDFFTEPGGNGRGASALEVSNDGETWTSLHNNLEPRNWGGDWTFDGALPAEVLGTTELWVRMRFYVENAPNSSYTVAQFGRSTSAATRPVFAINITTTTDAPPNAPPSGEVLIVGTAAEDQILTAKNTLADADGLGAISYQWSRNSVAVGGATDEQYTLAQADVGSQITLTATYTDDRGNVENVDSAPTVAVQNINDLPTGTLLITGAAIEDSILIANTSGTDDEDGLGAFSYQWIRNGDPITGATGSTYQLGQDDVQTNLALTVNYVDGYGHNESLHAVVNDPIANVNDRPVLYIDPSPTFNSILENAGAPTGPVGTLVTSLIDSSGPLNNYFDEDGDLPGIAVTATNLNGGTLWQSQDGGTTWNPAGIFSETAPLLLEANAGNRLYFQSPENFFGTISDVISFKAWDRTGTGAGAWQQLGDDFDGEAEGNLAGRSVSVSADGNTIVISEHRSDALWENSGQVRTYRWNGNVWEQLGVILGDGGGFGRSVSMSDDGNRIAVGSPWAASTGHASVYSWTGEEWQQIGQSVAGINNLDRQGWSVALSGDGSSLVVGASADDTSGEDAGRTTIYRFQNNEWLQVGSPITGEAAGDQSGDTVAISENGEIVAIGARYNDGNGTRAGHAQVFQWNGNAWQQLGNDLDGASELFRHGDAVSLSSDGHTLAVGAPQDDASGTGAGRTFIYDWNGVTWEHRGTPIDGEERWSSSGQTVSLSNDGNRVAIGAPYNDGAGRNAGHARVFEWAGNTWLQVAGDLDGEFSEDRFSQGLALAGDGKTLIVGTHLNDGTGPIGADTGHARVFRLATLDASLSIATDTTSIEILSDNVAEGLLVDQIVTGRDGVTVSFDGPLDLPNLDLHNRAASPEDLDVTLVDAAGGLVDAALAVNTAGDGFRLVVSNGLLTAGDYTLTIRSGEAGVVAADGRLLDGDGDGVGGDDFVSSFTVEPLPSGTAIVGVPGFFEDVGQEVSLPAVAGGGIPVIVTAPEGVMSLELEVFYNPALLEVSGVELAAGLPDGSLTLINVLTPGHAVVGFFSPQPLGSGSYAVARLLATVPASATTDQTHVLDVSNVSLNEGLIAAVDDDGIHVVAVGNRAPTGINLSSNTVVENSPVGTVIGMLEAIDSDYGDSFTFELVAGEGDSDNASFSVDGRQLIATTGFDFEAGVTRGIRIRVTDGEGESFEEIISIQIENQVETLYVTELESATDGFGISFSRPIDVSVINLYDAMDIYGESDLTLRGATTGDVSGSLVIAADGRSLQFVANAPLALDTYSVRVRSGSDAFQTVTGELLDGNADEEAGDSYNGTFTISEVPTVRLAIPSFARGPGQDVHVPVGSEAGIPLVLESDGSVRSLDAIFSFNPELLDVSDIVPAVNLPEFVTFSTEVLEPGRIALRFDASESFPGGGGAPAGQLTIANVMAQVATTAENGSSALLTLESVVSNGTVTVGGSNAVQVVASLGDTSGDGEYGSSDASLAARLAMRLDSGLVSYPVINPSLVADVSGNGTVSMLDAAMIAGIRSSSEGPELASAPPPRQMLLRHGGSFRRADVIDVSSVLSDGQTSLLAASRDSASTRAQAFADIAAGWAASTATKGSDTFLFAEDSDESRDLIFADPGLI